MSDSKNTEPITQTITQEQLPQNIRDLLRQIGQNISNANAEYKDESDYSSDSEDDEDIEKQMEILSLLAESQNRLVKSFTDLQAKMNN